MCTQPCTGRPATTRSRAHRDAAGPEGCPRRIDCGACEPVCPVEAIYFEDDTPQEWQHFTTVNAEFFSDLGAPGGSAKLGPTGRDHPIVAALPPRGAGASTLTTPPEA